MQLRRRLWALVLAGVRRADRSSAEN